MERSPEDSFASVVGRRFSRRDFLKGAAAAVVVYLPGVNTPVVKRPPLGDGRLRFEALAPSRDDAFRVANGYHWGVLVSWGDPVLPDAPRFSLADQSAVSQSRQFGYNCDFVGLLPYPLGSTSATSGLLVVNHEYTNPELMFADYGPSGPTAEQVSIQLAAQGLTVVRVRRDRVRGWVVDPEAPVNRRITGYTPTILTGPAAGHERMRSATDPTGTTARGTLANCSAGVTPWGTILSAEENFHLCFGNRLAVTDEVALLNHARYGIPREDSAYLFERHDPLFDLKGSKNAPFHYGWVVEVDPYDPTWVPRKRTALGRFRRESAATAVAKDGRVTMYSGDDIAFEYVYKFVTRDAFDPNDRERNRDLLDHGTLYVARFVADGTGIWLPLVYGQGALNSRNGFKSQADVLLNTVGAADLLRPTHMDRPEDIKVSPVTGKVYVSLTANPDRGRDTFLPTEPANPRRHNVHGHIIELIERNGDHASTRFTWNIFMLCGDPSDPTTFFAGYPRQLVSPISRPDNLTFDEAGNLWVATDGQPTTLGANDGVYGVPTEGIERGFARRFLSAVPGSEVCSPHFTPDFTTMFLSVQHPAEGSTLATPSSRWPFGDLPRPSVAWIEKNDGGRIGG